MESETSDVMNRSDDDDLPSLQADSGIGIDDSSVLNGCIFLFGRQYRDWGPAKENCEQYFCPNDEQELERLDIQHHAFLVLMDNKLHFAPVSTTSPINVLDVCTGTGIWAIDVADECPRWDVKGIDWAPMQPAWVPPNIKFEIDDLRRLWCYNNIFDYIHTRATIYMGCWKDFKLDVIHQAFNGLQPGGWFECQEIGGLVECDDGTLPSDAPLTSWARALNIAGSKMGRPRDVSGRISEWYKEVGFVDVQQHALKMPIGNWSQDTRMKEAGSYWKVSMERALEGLSLRLFNEAFGWELADITVCRLFVVLVEIGMLIPSSYVRHYSIASDKISGTHLFTPTPKSL
ncbi:S-adenosyl-L-methionine-dependent methyltransferase [Lasiosphaeris hirsuta]|uniref:S-adenosyl-L-methionine-dependent methyltransferase n=1 Tax=Lasiosphaeris hirsuta TaxID=260670 RepID=A0AA40ANK0_9PEZI|nr:S-adenosyl-L-methionine-dependent methyltransferase [Lasiosphaeris hirsuta]